jgi:hypothetical protein
LIEEYFFIYSALLLKKRAWSKWKHSLFFYVRAN